MKIFRKSENFFKLSLVIVLVASFLPLTVFASSTDGTIDQANKYAWGEKIGWINFGTNNGSIHITDSQITGYAWSENYGWINLQPSSFGVTNNGNGGLAGFAWGEQIGYLDFSGVTIDSSGNFHGYADSDTFGRVSFNCENTSSCADSNFKVSTDWLPSQSRGNNSGGTVSYGSVPSVPIPTTPPPAIPPLPIQPTPSIPLTSPTPSLLVPPFVLTDNQKFQASGICPYFTKILKKGNKDSEIIKVKIFLNFYGFLEPGMAIDNNFDPVMFEAVKKFQQAYSSNILKPSGLSSPTGNWYLASIKQANLLTECQSSGRLEILPTQVGYLNVRSGPSLKARIISKVKPGQQFGFSDVNDNWYFINFDYEKSGWVSGQYVKILK